MTWKISYTQREFRHVFLVSDFRSERAHGLTFLTIWQITQHRPRWLSWMRRPTGDQEVAGSTLLGGRQHSFVKIDHEIFSTVILSLPLIQEGQLSVSGERMCTILINRLEDYKPAQ